MRKRSILLTCSSALLAVAVWTACTGDDPTVTPTGGLAQPCSTGDTCNTPDLRCTDGFCRFIGTQSSDGGGTSSSSSSSGNTTSSSSGNVPTDAGSDGSDAGTDAASDAGDAGDSATPPPVCRALAAIDGGDGSERDPDAGVTCPLAAGGTVHCAAGKFCCPGTGCSDTADCANGSDGWGCLTTAACEPGAGCYIPRAEWFSDAGTCGATVGADRGADPPFVDRGSRCGGFSPPWIQLCTHEAQCDGFRCVPMSVVVNGITMVVGACTESTL